MKATRFRVAAVMLGLALALGLALRSWKGEVASGADSLLREGRGTVRSVAKLGRPATPALPSPTSRAIRSLSSSAPSTFHDFEAWVRARQLAAPGARAAMTAEGLALAEKRAREMAALIRENPEKALEWALPYELRQGLPEEVLARVERPVDGLGRLEVRVSCGEGGQGILRRVEMEGAVYAASVFGRRLDMGTKNAIPLHGISLEGVMAVDTHPYRLLGQAEAVDRGVGQGGIPALVGGTTFAFAEAVAVTRFEAQVQSAEASPGPTAYALGAWASGEPGLQPLPSPAWTTGQKSLLYIRCRFQDESQDALASSDALRFQGALDAFLRENSNGRLAISSVIMPVVLLPHTRLWYATQAELAFDRLLLDARAAARAMGYEPSAYDLDIVSTARIGGTFSSYSGLAVLGDRGVHLNGYFSLRTVGHEIGHNLGLHHANYNHTSASVPISRIPVDGQTSTWQEYGHFFSVMSGQASADMDSGCAHYTVQEKCHLGWLSGIDVAESASSGLSRLYRNDHISADGLRALKVPCSDPDRPWYWLSYRCAYGSQNAWLAQGVVVDWGRATYDADGAILLDMTPQSCDGPQGGFPPWDDNNDKPDAPLRLGKTYADPGAGIYITPVAKGGASPREYIDVYVWRGSPVADLPSSLSVQQTPSDVAVGTVVTLSVEGAGLVEEQTAFSWDFGDRVAQPNARGATWVAPAAGTYTLRCQVSNMRGGVMDLSRTLVVRNAGVAALPSPPVGEWVLPKEGSAGFLLPNEWKARFFGGEAATDPRFGAWADPGRTGMPLWQRYLLGLDPTNRHDRFAMSLDPSGLASARPLVVRWTSVVGRGYKVQSSEDLKTWQDASGVVVASSGNTEWSAPLAPPSERQKFYRVIVLPPQ